MQERHRLARHLGQYRDLADERHHGSNQNSSFVANVAGQWGIVGQRDFNGDGYADLLWRDTSGNVAIWEMNGTTVLNANSSFVANVPTNWSIVGTGDFNGDSMGDILWQDMSGNVAIWEMNGTTMLNQNSSFVANVAGPMVDQGHRRLQRRRQDRHPVAGHLGQRGDLGDERHRHIEPEQLVRRQRPGQWSIKGTGDFNGDGKS